MDSRPTEPPEYDLPDASNTPPPLDMFDLDAFGHLCWGIGFSESEDAPEDRGDWTAWADCDAKEGWIGYHVVIDSDSGGFCDGSLDKGVLSIEQAENDLPGLLSKWDDVASEHLVAAGHWFTPLERTETLKIIEDWKGKVTETIAEARGQQEKDS